MLPDDDAAAKAPDEPKEGPQTQPATKLDEPLVKKPEDPPPATPEPPKVPPPSIKTGEAPAAHAAKEATRGPVKRRYMVYPKDKSVCSAGLPNGHTLIFKDGKAECAQEDREHLDPDKFEVKLEG